MGGWNIIMIGFGASIFIALSYISIPKGPNQTTIRTSLILTIICCYLMWAIAYLAQLHPLITPKSVGGIHHEELKF
ncbi:ATPase, V0 complex, subunit E1/e2 [Gigaspora margarita]|uniref:ATPase, V0 complex, subunit E1/e2 n=1 Tax=Gigaspora margarita TaxID=4874 RepID=A0A8H3XG09_GIGMA|nr:ATPase, V0 complex, subunit E1/e2 [Gigaspora margarita]